MSNRSPTQLRQRAAANGHRIQLDVDVHADIDHDFFDVETKAIASQKKHTNGKNSVTTAQSTRITQIVEETKFPNEDEEIKEGNTNTNFCEVNVGIKKNLINTTSITDVSSRSTSSEYSLLKRDNYVRNGSPSKQNKTRTKMKRLSPMKTLHEDFEHLEIGDHGSDSRSSSSMSYKSGYMEKSMFRKRNMSFSEKELRVIKRDNETLLKKIEVNRTSRPQPLMAPANFSLSSSAINRRNIQRSIDADNKRLVRKLEKVRASTDTSSPWVFSRR